MTTNSKLDEAIDGADALMCACDLSSEVPASRVLPIIDHDKAAMVSAHLRTLIAATKALRDGVTKVDAALAACPINSTNKHFGPCPKCGATEDQNCGPDVQAMDDFVTAARNLVHAQKDTPHD